MWVAAAFGAMVLSVMLAFAGQPHSEIALKRDGYVPGDDVLQCVLRLKVKEGTSYPSPIIGG
ncbi:hypothetical protein [Arthrobacter sp. ISL-72]|uniref:hypothetical protein n=1 Tax=Arthrobacter sp. ISL-72 TaxID=2819114 RepID=UPI001BE65EAA|nr:hypothetical protein [Arthrobacter sp. ISL-72]MBT2596227.1 hypothetical protein [Arthrobacter sp. ISL-72]